MKNGESPENPTFVDLGDGWFQKGDMVSRLDWNCLTVINLAAFRPTDAQREMMRMHEESPERFRRRLGIIPK